MKKQFILFALVAAMLFSVAGCGLVKTPPESTDAPDKPRTADLSINGISSLLEFVAEEYGEDYHAYKYIVDGEGAKEILDEVIQYHDKNDTTPYNGSSSDEEWHMQDELVSLLPDSKFAREMHRQATICWNSKFYGVDDSPSGTYYYFMTVESDTTYLYTFTVYSSLKTDSKIAKIVVEEVTENNFQDGLTFYYPVSEIRQWEKALDEDSNVVWKPSKLPEQPAFILRFYNVEDELLHEFCVDDDFAIYDEDGNVLRDHQINNTLKGMALVQGNEQKNHQEATN